MKNAKNAMLVLFVVPFLTMPAFAGSSNVGDKLMVVTEDVHIGVGGVRIEGDERNRYRDHAVVVDPDRAVVIDREHHHDRDHDRDQDHR
jgi:hypothetical protein